MTKMTVLRPQGNPWSVDVDLSDLVAARDAAYDAAEASRQAAIAPTWTAFVAARAAYEAGYDGLHVYDLMTARDAAHAAYCDAADRAAAALIAANDAAKNEYDRAMTARVLAAGR